MNTLQSVTTFASLLIYVGDELDWPVDNYELEDLTFDYDSDELGLKDEDAAKIKDGKIRQLRPLSGSQPFGIFFVEFGKKKLPIVVLRRILSQLIIKKRSNAAEAKRWDTSDLLFVSAFGEEGEREVAFAHFHKESNTPDLPILRVLGWDGSDTPLKLDYVERLLRQRLCWPDDTSDQDTWREQWRAAFQHKPGHVISTASALAETLAAFARKIRDAASTIIEHESEEKGHLRRLHHGFRDALIHDLTEEDFADTYAQTVTYGLLTAAVSKTDPSCVEDTTLTTGNISDMVPVTNPFLKEMLEEFLKAGGRKGGIDFDELGIQDVVELLRDPERTDLAAVLRDFGNKTKGEDPVIHFYEHFLEAYNKELRIQRGVFYTPKPVVSYIVRSVNELLKTEFDLEDALASTITWGQMLAKNPELELPPLTDEEGETQKISKDEFFVQILDPATGTATFPVEVIDVIHQHLLNKWNKGGLAAMPDLRGVPRGEPIPKKFEDYWQHYVPLGLLPRLYGYELLMAPYAIAHMKIGLKLHETGYRFGSDERARIYLTNALEPKVKQLPQIGFDALAHEAAAVNEVKWYKRFTVVIGNPPYSGISSNMTEYAQRIVDAYKFVDGSALNERKLWLQDDYVKFIRRAQTTIETARVGVLGYITNHSYLDNPTFRGMRQSLMGTFECIRLLDIHGNTTKKEKSPDGTNDKNIFDIKQGVAVSLATRGGTNTGILHTDLWGSRERKYSWIGARRLADTSLARLSPDSPFYFFNPQNVDYRAEYEEGWKVTDMMPSNTTGFVTARDHFVVGFSESELLDRVAEFAGRTLSDAEIRALHFAGKGSSKYDDGDSRGWKLPEARKRVRADKHWKERVVDCLYRPLDPRKIYWCDWMVDWPRPEVTRHLLAGENFSLNIGRAGQVIDQGQWNIVFCTRSVTEFNLFRRGGNSLFPLWLYEDGTDSQAVLGTEDHKRLNIKPAFLKALAQRLSLAASGQYGVPRGLTPEDIFHYAYAVFHSPGYRSRYSEFLKIDFPRLPLTGKLKLFHALAQLGRGLTALHLLESPKLDTPVTEFVGTNTQVSKVIYTADNGGNVWIDGKGTAKKPQAGTSGFTPVPEAVWNFHIGGYQVCEKWLKDRGPKKGNPGRTLTAEDIVHYHKIVISLTETIRIMKEIDEVIETHGGWPGAFQNNCNEASLAST